MLTAVHNTSLGYVVEVFLLVGSSWSWHPLRNFGDRQGDARDFAFVDVPSFSESQIKLLRSSYSPRRLYMRCIRNSKFVSLIRVE